MIAKYNNLLNSILVLTIFSCLQVYFNQGEINNDGLFYLINAQHIVNGNIHLSYENYNWPFFSFLIAYFHKITGLTLFYSAQFICISLFIIASFFFLKIISLLSNNNVSPFFGAVILITSIPIFDDYLVMILRDHGLWAGFLSGLYFYLRWIKEEKIFYLYLWFSCLIIGALFRLEAFIILLSLFITSFIILHKDKVSQLKQLIFLIFLISLLIISFKGNIDYLRVDEIFSRPKQVFFRLFAPLPIFSNDIWLSTILEHYLSSFKFLFFTFITLYKWFYGLGLLALFLFYIAMKNKLISRNYQIILFILFFTSVIMPILNLYQYYVLSSRYFVLSWFIVYIYSVFGLHFIWKNNFFLTKYKLSTKFFVCIYLLFSFCNTLIDKEKDNSERNTSKWITKNIVKKENIYFEVPLVSYYSNLLPLVKYEFNDALISTNFNYFVIKRSSKSYDVLNQKTSFELIKTFDSANKNNEILIYKRILN